MDDEVRSSRNHDYRVINESGEFKHDISSGAQLKMVLSDYFGILVNEAEAVRLFELSA